MEKVAEHMSQGVVKTSAYAKVSTDMKIPYGNFPRWMKVQKRIEQEAQRSVAAQLLGRKAWNLVKHKGTLRRNTVQKDIGFSKLDQALMDACKDRNHRPICAPPP